MGSGASVDKRKSQKQQGRGKSQKNSQSGSHGSKQHDRHSGNGHIPNNQNRRRSNPNSTATKQQKEKERRSTNTDPLPVRSKHHNKDITVSKSSEKNRTSKPRGKNDVKGSFLSGKKSRASTNKYSSTATPSKCSSTLQLPTTTETTPVLKYKRRLNNALEQKLKGTGTDKVIKNNLNNHHVNHENDKNNHQMFEKVHSLFDFEKMQTLLSLSSQAAYQGKPEQYEESKLLKDVDLVNWHKEEELRLKEEYRVAEEKIRALLRDEQRAKADCQTWRAKLERLALEHRQRLFSHSSALRSRLEAAEKLVVHHENRARQLHDTNSKMKGLINAVKEEACAMRIECEKRRKQAQEEFDQKLTTVEEQLKKLKSKLGEEGKQPEENGKSAVDNNKEPTAAKPDKAESVKGLQSVPEDRVMKKHEPTFIPVTLVNPAPQLYERYAPHPQCPPTAQSYVPNGYYGPQGANHHPILYQPVEHSQAQGKKPSSRKKPSNKVPPSRRIYPVRTDDLPYNQSEAHSRKGTAPMHAVRFSSHLSNYPTSRGNSAIYQMYRPTHNLPGSRTNTGHRSQKGQKMYKQPPYGAYAVPIYDKGHLYAFRADTPDYYSRGSSIYND